MYKCFLCSKGGDVFKFVRQMAATKEDGKNEMGFLQSNELVANRYGLSGMKLDFVSSSFQLSEEWKAQEAKK